MSISASRAIEKMRYRVMGVLVGYCVFVCILMVIYQYNDDKAWEHIPTETYYIAIWWNSETKFIRTQRKNQSLQRFKCYCLPGVGISK